MDTPASSVETLFTKVGFRQMLARVGKWFFVGTLAASVVYLLLLLGARLLAIIPNFFEPWTLSLVPAAGLLVSLFALRRPARASSAREIDKSAGTKDLFLTESYSQGTTDGGASEPGAENFSPIVSQQAANRAAEIKPAAVIPWNWAKRGAITVGTLAILLAGSLFIPQLDPFGNDEKRRLIGQREERLQSLRKETEKRAEVLKKVDAKTRTPEVAKALAELEKTFQQAKPKEKDKNLAKLQANQKDLGKLWKKIDSEKLKNAMAGDSMKQALGAMQSKETKAMREAVRKGDVKPVQEKLADIKKQLEKAEKATDPAEKRAAQQQARQQIQELSSMLSQEIGSKKINEALQRAMEQLDMSALEGMDKEALEAAKESLGLSQQELEELAKSMQDQQALEDALAAIQDAKKLAGMEKLDGGECEGCKGIGDYKKLFEKMTGGSGEGEGEGEGEGSGKGLAVSGEGDGGKGNGTGMKGEGTGEGGIAPEDEGLETGHKTSKAPSALQGGKMLMEWKTKGVSEPGEAAISFDESIQNVKEGVGEAIRAERVPPSYIGGIQKYFDTLEEVVEPEAAAENPSGR